MKTERDIFKAADALLKKAIREELRAQGHRLTGALEKSIMGQINSGSGTTTLDGTALGYAGILNDGVDASKIPYSPGKRTGAGSSRYIQGLITFWKLRGLGEAEATRAAFATARKQKQEGMSTKASRRFSASRRRQGFIAAVYRRVSAQVDKLVLSGYDEVVNNLFKETGNEKI